MYLKIRTNSSNPTGQVELIYTRNAQLTTCVPRSMVERQEFIRNVLGYSFHFVKHAIKTTTFFPRFSEKSSIKKTPPARTHENMGVYFLKLREGNYLKNKKRRGILQKRKTKQEFPFCFTCSLFISFLLPSPPILLPSSLLYLHFSCSTQHTSRPL